VGGGADVDACLCVGLGTVVGGENLNGVINTRDS